VTIQAKVVLGSHNQLLHRWRTILTLMNLEVCASGISFSIFSSCFSYLSFSFFIFPLWTLFAPPAQIISANHVLS